MESDTFSREMCAPGSARSVILTDRFNGLRCCDVRLILGDVALDKRRLVTAAHDAFNARNLERFLDSWAESCEYTPAVEMALEPGRPYRGHDGLRLYWERIEDRWEELRTKLDDVKDVGELTFVSGSFRAVGRQSHVALESPLFEVVAFRSSKILTCSDYLDRDAALAELEQGLP